MNSTIWGALALRAAGGRAAGPRVRCSRRQRPAAAGPGASAPQPDSNDTAAAVQALRAAGVRGRRSAAARLPARHQNRDGGFELTEGRGSDVQSTAWAIQAFVAAGQRPPRAPFRYLARMRRADGSYRYSAATPRRRPG